MRTVRDKKCQQIQGYFVINAGLDGTAFFEGLRVNERQNTILVEGMLINGNTHSISRTFATGRIQVKCLSACKCLVILSKHAVKMVHVTFLVSNRFIVVLNEAK